MNEEQLKKLMSIQGWFNANEMNILYPYVFQLPETALLVEIGTFHGKSTLFWHYANPHIRILTNDICSPEGMGTQPNQVNIGTVIPDRIDQTVLDEGNIFQVRGSSHEVVKTFNWDIDFLFIDSEHSYQDTVDTLREWGQFVKRNHFIACHDYTDSFPGVKEAVMAYTLEENKELISEREGIAIIKV